ncbi:MAG: FAD-dependent oxidoreductase [Myxococcales bacterium]|nr:FAD-dependent oxidoreductase [Myxococcales bacterium]
MDHAGASDAKDVVIVGAGPAGISTALFLAHHAKPLAGRIVVLEKARFPRDKPCAGAIGRRAELALETIGVVVDVPGVTVRGMSASLLDGAVVEAKRGVIGRVVRRKEFDAALARAAIERGVTVLEDTRVERVAWGRDAVTLATSRGEMRASVVIGADGVGSIVRRAMGVPFGNLRAQVVEVDTDGVPGDGPRDVLRFDFADHALAGYTWDFATVVAGRELVCRGAYVLGGVPSSRKDVDAEAVLDAHLARLGRPAERGPRKRFSERGLELSRPLACRRGLLVGEAAGIDPWVGEGIAQAVLYGAAAGEYLADKLCRPRPSVTFRDWRLFLLRKRVGIDLALRSAVARLFYGSRRAVFEAAAKEPALLDSCLRYFAGEPSKRALASATWSALIRSVQS